MGLSLKKLGKSIYEAITPQDENALRRSEASLARANQALSSAPKNYGVLRNPQATQRVIQQNRPQNFNLGRSALTSFADTLTKPERLASAPRANVGSFFGSGFIEDIINSPYKIAGGGVKIGQGQIKQGIGDVITGAIEGPLGFIPIGKAAQASTKATGLLPKVVAGAKAGLKEGAVYGGLYSGGSAASQNAPLKDIARAGATGAVVGGTAGAVLGGGIPVATAGGRKIVQAVDNRVPLNQVGAVGKSPTPQGKSPAVKPTPVVTAKTPAGKGSATRGFKKNVFKGNFYDGNPTAKAVVEAMPGYKPITNKRTLAKAADEINQDPTRAYAKIATKPQLTTADDVATGNLLLRDAIEKGDTESAIQLGTKLGIDGTKLGQAVQAYATWKKTTPEGILRYATKKSASVGKELSEQEAKSLIETAKRIAAMPEGLERAKATRELLVQADNLGRDWKSMVGELLSTPRAAMATADLSAPLRQGAVLGSRFPKQFKQASKEMFGYFKSEGAFEKSMYEISQRPSYPLMKQHKLAVDGAQGLTGTEEMFLKNILETDVAKKLVVGRVVSASNRAYTGFLTKLRADVFDKIVADSKATGVNLDKGALDSLAKFINSASGRGDGNITRQVSRLQVLFSPRLWKSRLDVLNPGYYASLDPVARKYALQASASFMSAVATTLGLAAAAGATVNLDPRSADFAKIKVGDTRYDIMGGLQQNIRLIAQQITGQKINSVTGEVQTLGPDRGFGKPSRLDLLYQFVESKENPTVAFGTKLLRGTDPVGNPINPATEAGKLFVPLTAQQAWETAINKNSLTKGIAMNIPGVFGVGVQTYGQEKAPPKKSGEKKPNVTSKTAQEEKKEIKAGEGYSLQQLSDGKYAYTIDGDDTVRTAKNLKDARNAIAKDSFARSDKKELLTKDRYYYKNSDGEVRSMGIEAYKKKLATAEKKSRVRTAGGRGRRGGSAGSVYKYAVSPSAGGKSSTPKVAVSRGGIKGIKGATVKAAKPKVSVKRSKV